MKLYKISFIKNEKFILIFLFVITFIIRLPFVGNSPNWDTIGHYFPCALNIVRVGILSCVDIVRPPLFFLTIAAVYKITGSLIWSNNLIIFFLSFLTVYFTYLIGKELKDRKTGFIAAILLNFSPMFFAQTIIISMDPFVTSFMIMTLYFFIKDNIIGYVILGSLALLSKETAAFMIPGLMLYAILKELNSKNTHKTETIIKKIFILLIPVFILLLWTILIYGYTGRFYKKEHFFVLNYAIEGILSRLNNRTLELFFKDYRFILTSIITLATAKFVYYKGGTFWRIFAIASVLEILNLYFFKNDVFHILWLFSILAYAFVAYILSKRLDYLLLYSPIFTILIFFGFYDVDFPRYILPAYPFYFTLCAICITEVFVKFKKSKILFLVLFLLLSFSQYYGHRQADFGPQVEDNLEVLDFIQVRHDAINFIERNYPNSTIVTSWWDVGGRMTNPEFGSTSKKLNLKILEVDWVHVLNKNDLFLYPPFHRREVIEKYQEVYDMKLLKRFEVNGKYLELYIIEGRRMI